MGVPTVLRHVGLGREDIFWEGFRLINIENILGIVCKNRQPINRASVVICKDYDDMHKLNV